MDLKSLQATLRRFAAERAWEPFHTPKNLAMALMVEAAELGEIFQWMTPEQSARAAHADPVLQERVADELADVLLYLAQIADHTGVDLERAAERKLVKNARKYPPVRAVPASPPPLPLPAARQAEAVGSLSSSSSPAQPKVHVLVDWENVQPKDDAIRALVPQASDLWLFHGPNQKNVGAHHASFGARATPVRIARTGKNALDFHLSFYLGYLAARQPDASFVVISNDKGYLPMLEHAKQLGVVAGQVGVARGRARASGGSARGATKPRAAKKKAAAPRKSVAVVAKRAPAKKIAAPKPVVVTDKPAAAAAKPAAVAAKMPGAAKRAVPAKTAVPAKAAVAAKKSRSPSRRARAPAAKAARGVDAALDKSVQRVIDDLRKMDAARRPTKQARLLAYIGSMLGSNADDPTAHAVLGRLLAGGVASAGARGELRFEL